MQLCDFMVVILLIYRPYSTCKGQENFRNSKVREHEFLEEFDNLRQELKSGYPKFSDSVRSTTPPPPTGSRYQPEFLVTRDGSYGTVWTDVRASFDTMRIVKMNADEETAVLKIRENYMWNDTSLAWNSSIQRNGNESQENIVISSLIFDNDTVWTPRLYARNVLHKKVVRDIDGVLCLSGGQCYLYREMQYKVPCVSDVRDFPFDKHSCSLIMSQTTDFYGRVNFQTWFDKSYPQTGRHQQWKIVDRQIRLVPSDSQLMVNDFQYTVVIQRQAAFYFTVLILPCILLNLLSLTIFTMSVKDTGRMSFCLALILTYFFLITIIVTSSPPSGNQMPLLGLYVILSSAVAALTFGMSVLLVEMQKRCREKGVPTPEMLTVTLEKCFKLNQRFEKFKVERGYVEDKSPESCNDGDSGILGDDGCQNRKGGNRKLKDEFKWKLLGKILNVVFLLITVLAHVLIAFVTFV